MWRYSTLPQQLSLKSLCFKRLPKLQNCEMTQDWFSSKCRVSMGYLFTYESESPGVKILCIFKAKLMSLRLWSLSCSWFRPPGISIVLLQFCFEIQIMKLPVQEQLEALHERTCLRWPVFLQLRICSPAMGNSLLESYRLLFEHHVYHSALYYQELSFKIQRRDLKKSLSTYEYLRSFKDWACGIASKYVSYV